MTFREYAQEIRGAWIERKTSKLTAIMQFNILLHEHGLMPRDEELGDDIEDRLLMSLLNQACSLRDERLPKRSPSIYDDNPFARMDDNPCRSIILDPLDELSEQERNFFRQYETEMQEFIIRGGKRRSAKLE
jgi:hypothetical protein